MAALHKIAGRVGKKKAVVASTLAISLGALLFATEAPVSLGSGSASAALAELVARSPGMRVGGTALKAKKPKLATVSSTSDTPAGTGVPSPANPVASVLGSTAGPEGAVPASGPGGGFPTDFLPAIPGAAGPIGAAPGPGSPDFGSPGGPAIGGLPIIGGGFPGGGTPGGGGGGGGGIIPPETGGPVNPPPTPEATPTPPAPPPPPMGVVPEPSTWLLLIGGFGFIGGAMRRKLRVRFA